MVEETSSEKRPGPTVYTFHKINTLIRDQFNVILLNDNDSHTSGHDNPQVSKSPVSFVTSKNNINSSSPSPNLHQNEGPSPNIRRRSSSISPKSRRRRHVNNDVHSNSNVNNNAKNNNNKRPNKSERRSAFRSKISKSLRKYFNTLLWLVEVFVCDVILSSLLPIIAPLMILNLLLRYVISLYYRFVSRRKIKLMKGEDAFWAFESPANPGNFTSMYVIKGHANLQKIRDKLTSTWIDAVDPSTGRPRFAKLKCKAVKLPCGYFGWEHSDSFDVNSHIRYLHPQFPNRPTNESQLFHELSNNYDVCLPSVRPPWEILVVPNYVYNCASSNGSSPHYAIIFRIHHSIMDGLSAAQVLRILVADELVPAGVDPMAPIKSTLLQRVILYVTALALTGPYVLRQNYFKEENSAFWSRDGLKGPKVLSWTRPIRMDAVKKIKDATRSSVSAIFSAVTGSAIRNFSVKRGHGIPKKVTAASCAALIPYPSLKAQNRFCVLFTPLPVAEGDDPLECVRDVQQATPNNFLLAAEVVMAYWITWLGGSFPVFINNWLQFGICQATTLLSNLPGPQKSTKIFGGDVIQDIVGWSPIRNRIGVGICLFGYNGRLRANVIADGAAFPNGGDVSLFIEEFEKEIRLLGAKCSLSDEDCFDEPQLHTTSFNSHLLTE